MDMGVSAVFEHTLPKNMALIEKPKTYRKNGAQVTELNYYLPKGKHSNLIGSYSYSPPSLKSGKLQAQIRATKRQMEQLRRGDRSAGEYFKKRQALQCKMKYLETKLSAEIGAQGVVRVNVHERE